MGSGPQGPFDHLFKLKSTTYNVEPGLKFNPDELFLYAVTDSGMNKKWGRYMTDAIEAAIKGGATIIQLRSYVFSLNLSMIFFVISARPFLKSHAVSIHCH